MTHPSSAIAMFFTASLFLGAGAAAQELDFNPKLSLAPASSGAGEASAPVAGASSDPFAEGKWILQIYGSATLADDAGDLYLGHVGVGYHFLQDFSVNLEIIGGIVESKQNPPGFDQTWMTGIELILRWHFFRSGPLSLYTDGGAGVVWFGENFPFNGTRQNFTPQAGFGITYQVCDQCLIMAGARWHHVSNARKSGKDRNPGFDGAMIYAGVMMPF